MSKDSSGEKTQAPTPKKLKEAREQGQVARSPDVSAWATIGAAGAALPLVIGQVNETFRQHMSTILSVISEPDPALLAPRLGTGLRDMVSIAIPLALLTMTVAVAATATQGGVHLATKAAKPKFERLNIGKGLKRLLSAKTAWEGLKTLIKSLVVGVVLWQTMTGVVPLLMAAGQLPLGATVGAVRDGAFGLIRAAVAAGLVVAALDYVVTRRRTMKQLRMSHKEVTDEHKQTEGDPMLKGARRSRQLAMSRNRMMREVATADAVLVNPTHIAVAIRYEPAKGAPRVVAKGGDTLAAKIRSEATAHRVPMVENVALARAVYFSCDLGAEIPMELYTAVAQVLAFVMRLRSRGAGSGMYRLQVNAVPADSTQRRPRRRRRPRRTATART